MKKGYMFSETHEVKIQDSHWKVCHVVMSVAKVETAASFDST